MSVWPPITRDDLRDAARRAGFDSVFPLLVRRLIAETADGLTELDMPGGSGVAAGGFDGVVTATGQTPEVPAGTSVWELSVTDNTGVKAAGDCSWAAGKAEIPPLLGDGEGHRGVLDEHWHLLAAEDAWMPLSAHLTRDDLDAFSAAAAAVLIEPDPFFAMDGAARLSAQSAGVHRTHSSALRTGLATTLALLGATELPLPRSSSTNGSDLARRTVRSILDAANADGTHAVWSGLRDVLGLLAEAAPEEFLQAMRDGLQGEHPLHSRMFTDSADDHSSLAPPPSHTECLRALEVLAWAGDGPGRFDPSPEATS